MSRAKAGGTCLDFVLYLGDPDGGANAIPSADLVARYDQYRDAIGRIETAYGAVCLIKDGEELTERKPDPIVKLVTALLKALPYVIDGEPEAALLSESSHGFLMEPAADKVAISFFRGDDAFDPEEYLVAGFTLPLEEFGSQLIAMGDRMSELLKKKAPDSEYATSLKELLEAGKRSLRAYRIESERGLRH